MPELPGQATELTKTGPMAKTSTELSKFLSFVLRHKPDAIGLTLDAQGWADVADLIERANAAGTRFELADLEAVVETNDKKRFTLSDDGKRIRAAQGAFGHSRAQSFPADAARHPLPWHGRPFPAVDPVARVDATGAASGASVT